MIDYDDEGQNVGRVGSGVTRQAGGEGADVGLRDEAANPTYVDIPGFYKSATLLDIRRHGHVLTPGRYVGAEVAGGDGKPFAEKMQRLTTTLYQQHAEPAKLDAVIAANLREFGYGV